LTVTVSLSGWDAQAIYFKPQNKIDFARDIQPLLQTHCVKCHGAEKQMAQLRLDDPKLAAPVIVPGQSRTSRLLHRVLGFNAEARMPKGGEPLKPEQIELLSRWIDEGAVWPAQMATSEASKHWAFVPPKRVVLPLVKDKLWGRNPIDSFILAKLER